MTRSWAQNKISNFSSIPYNWWRSLLSAKERLQPPTARTKCRITVTQVLLLQILILFCYFYCCFTWLLMLSHLERNNSVLHLFATWWITVLVLKFESFAIVNDQYLLWNSLFKCQSAGYKFIDDHFEICSPIFSYDSGKFLFYQNGINL